MLIQSGISFTVATATQTADAGVAPATGTGMADDAVAPEIQGAPIEEAQTPGVLRHLQAGKFKGVADVRLRIVFQKQLAELAEQQAKARASRCYRSRCCRYRSYGTHGRGYRHCGLSGCREHSDNRPR
jgi:hypothetical protein